MVNRFKIYFDCRINVPDLFLKFEGFEPFHMKNHSVREVEIEPGCYKLFVAYQMVVGDSSMDFTKELEAVIEPGWDYTAKICMVLKSFTWLKRVSGSQRCC